MDYFKFKIIKSGKILYVTNEQTNLNDWPKYRESLKSFQKSINTHLTTLVEKDAFEVVEISDDDDVSSPDEMERSPKRILNSPTCVKKKIPKI